MLLTMKLSICILLFSLSAITCFAQETETAPADAAYIRANYSKTEYRIKMRDGIELFTSVYSPKDHSKKYPVMMDRTPYSVGPYGPDAFKTAIGPSSLFVHDNYIFVYQDVRGRWMSGGMFREMTPEKYIHLTVKDVDEGTDTYDTIDWLVKNLPDNNGKVGVWGISYNGYFSTTSLLSRHPALACVSPQAPMADLYRDDAFHNGAFMLVANFSFYPGFTNRQNDQPTQRKSPEFEAGTEDGYQFFMKMATVKNTNDLYYKDTIRLWNEMLDHPDYDQHWKERNILSHLTNIKTPVLVTGGWYDAEDLYGALKTYQTLVKNNPLTPAYFSMGPWVHGGWSRGDGDHLGDVDFGQKTGPWYREKIEFNFFSHYLKGTKISLPVASMFETGSNQWKSFKSWPPKEAITEKIYLQPQGKLGFSAPDQENTSDAYVSDPAKAVPFTASVTNDMIRTYMTEDQRFASSRPDVLSYQTEILKTDLTLGGNIMARLNVSTSGTDADWVVKIIDVYPDSASNTKWTREGENMSGYQQMVRSEAFRGKYRNSLSKPEAFIPDKISPVNIELQDILHTFKKGHRLMVQIQSTWFPLIDRNPQQFMNIMKARPADFKKAVNKIYTSAAHQSYLSVSVLN